MTLAECNESIYVTALRHVAPKMGDNDKMQRAFWSYAYDQVKDMVRLSSAAIPWPSASSMTLDVVRFQPYQQSKLWGISMLPAYEAS